MLKVNPAVAEVIVIVPVATVHVGSTTSSAGAAGAVGTSATGTSTAVVQPDPLSTVIVCGPGRTFVYPPAGYGPNTPLSKLKVSPAVAEVMVMVPVATVHVGSTT